MASDIKVKAGNISVILDMDTDIPLAKLTKTDYDRLLPYLQIKYTDLFGEDYLEEG